MARKPFPRPGAGAPTATQSEAVGKFDKFATFALALPVTIMAVIALIVADGYTLEHLGWSMISTPTVASYDSSVAGSDGIVTATGQVKIIGFSQQNYIGRSSEGEVDSVELNVGYSNGVRLGDVFTLKSELDGVWLEFTVFDIQSNTSRAYILLGQNLSGTDAKRKTGLKRSQLVELCGAESDIDVQRLWQNQIIRRYVEVRAKGG